MKPPNSKKLKIRKVPGTGPRPEPLSFTLTLTIPGLIAAINAKRDALIAAKNAALPPHVDEDEKDSDR